MTESHHLLQMATEATADTFEDGNPKRLSSRVTYETSAESKALIVATISLDVVTDRVGSLIPASQQG